MRENTSQVDGREGLLKLLFGRISCIVGLLLSTGGFVVATLGASVNPSAGAVGIALGVLGYFLGARRLGAASVFVSDRRYREEGVLRAFLLHLLMAPAFALGKFAWANHVTYEFGDHDH